MKTAKESPSLESLLEILSVQLESLLKILPSQEERIRKLEEICSHIEASKNDNK